MAFENNNEMSRMQQDAIRRVQEMQSRAQQSVRNSSRDVQHEPLRVPEPSRHESTAMREMPNERHNDEHHQENPITDIFESLMQDKERTLILVLILLLIEEKSDTGAILALMYLVL
jgi:hypothetical protein